MKEYQKKFILFALQREILRFGEFTLKSGRKSPYFFNSGLFNDGESLTRLGHFYARALTASGLEYDGIFGPAYKGIPLVSTLAVALAHDEHRSVPYSFNRKEAKDHGEGGMIVGAPLKGKIVIVDDVISAGTSIRESIDIINASGAQTAGVLIALDRQEKGQGETSAIMEIEKQYGIPVISIIKLENLIAFLKNDPELAHYHEQVVAYKKQYGVN